MVKVVPELGCVEKDIEPWELSMMVLDMASPRPMPELLVVKLGRKILSRMLSSMPSPLSVTVMRTL